MTPFFARLDLAPDAVFLLWVAGGMVAIGLVIGAYMVGKRAWRWVGRADRRYELAHKRFEEQRARVERRLRERR